MPLISMPLTSINHIPVIYVSVCLFWSSLVAQTVKRLPTMQETQVRSLGLEDPLEKETATHSSIHAWKIPWTGRDWGAGGEGDDRG